MRCRILLGLFFCAIAVASAQTTNSPANSRPISLRNCIDLALTRNLDLQIKHLTVEMAGAALSSAYGVYSPNFTFDALHSYESDLGSFDDKKFNPYFPPKLPPTSWARI